MQTVMQEQKRKILIEELTNRNILKTQTGKGLNDASYEELKYELVLASFREIDVECDAHRWF